MSEADGATTLGDYRPIGPAGRTLHWMLGATALMAMVGIWSDLLEIQLLRGALAGSVITDAEATANDDRQALIGVAYLLMYIATAIAFLRWTHRAAKNARWFGAPGMAFTPGWAVGWYFVPILTLWKPYQALKEIFKASHPEYGDDWHRAPHPALLPLWWTLWIGATFVGRAVLGNSMSAETLEEVLTASQLTLLGDVVDLPLVAVVAVLVSEMTALQTRKHRRSTEAAGDDGAGWS